MFGQKRNNINNLKRKWMAILFLVIFVTFGISLSGMLQSEINMSNSRPVPVQVSSEDEYEEDIPELLEPIEIEKPRELYVLMSY